MAAKVTGSGRSRAGRFDLAIRYLEPSIDRMGASFAR